MKGISDRLFLVTGGARGIGEAIARRIVEDKGRVIICDVDEAGAKTAETIKANGGEAYFRELDVTNSKQVAALAESVAAEFGPVYGLVNNAGISVKHEAFSCSDDTWARTLDVNLTGVFYCCREFGKQMRQSGGSIVNVSSICGLIVVQPETHVAYGASKAAVAHMASLLSVEWASYGIRVNAVAPGYTETTINATYLEQHPEVVQAWIEKIPMKRLNRPSEIANAVAFLLSDEASCITGALLVADGGFTRL